MSTTAYSEKASKRIVHIKSHTVGRESAIENMVRNVENNLGDPIASAMGLSSNALANAMLAWFGNHDLNAMKNWCYTAAKLDQLGFQMQEEEPSWSKGFPQLLKVLLSDHNDLIDWFARYDSAYDIKRAENHKTHDFWAYQAIVAIRGDWPRLTARCERIISDPPGASKEQKYLLDHHFYLALAQGDIEQMQDVLQEIVSYKAINARLDYESGFTADLISTPAVIYAKIAWRHGYKVKVDSPYIPQEWLPVKPLDHYDNHYAFLK